MKNEKFLLDIQTKCDDIANEICYVFCYRSTVCEFLTPLELERNLGIMKTKIGFYRYIIFNL